LRHEDQEYRPVWTRQQDSVSKNPNQNKNVGPWARDITKWKNPCLGLESLDSIFNTAKAKQKFFISRHVEISDDF
jgi:hypothetical protein